MREIWMPGIGKESSLRAETEITRALQRPSRKAELRDGKPWADRMQSLLIDNLDGLLAANGRAVRRRRRVRTLANRPKRSGENT
jgi:hypothetical protein